MFSQDVAHLGQTLHVLMVTAITASDKQVHAMILTHSCLVSHFWDLGKQCRPRSDVAEGGVGTGSTLFAYRNFYNLFKIKYMYNEKVHQIPLVEMDSSN